MYVTAAMEKSRSGVGVSTSARIAARKHYAAIGASIWVSAPNAKLNDLLAMDFQNAQPVHRFKLKSKEVAEIRKSSTFTYVAKMTGGSYNIITLQRTYLEPRKPEISKRRLKDLEWVKER